jgi:nucleoid-associated protein YgaU
MAFLVFRITTLNAQLREANDLSAPETTNGSDIMELRIELEKRDETIKELNARIEILLDLSGETENGPVWENGDESTHAPSEGTPGRPDESPDENAAAVTVPSGAQTYTVVSGDNLSKISQRFYGNANPSSIDRIRQASRLTNDNLYVGQELIIPAE